MTSSDGKVASVAVGDTGDAVRPSQAATSAEAREIVILGAKEHNLSNIDVRIPRDKLVVITGLSGSGKSSLAFDTIYAEGQRKYVESLSASRGSFSSNCPSRTSSTSRACRRRSPSSSEVAGAATHDPPWRPPRKYTITSDCSSPG